MEKDLEKLIAKKNPHEGHRARMRCKFDRDPEMETIEDHEALEFHLSLIIPRKDTNELAHKLYALIFYRQKNRMFLHSFTGR